MSKKFLSILLVLVFTLSIQPASAGNTDTLSFMEEKVGGYDRSLFKHWIDEDKDGCDTRKEVLIEEAIVKPKIGKKCVLSGGTWLSSYDNKTIKGSGSTLDVDHMVPLAEAWRSGAWQWTNAERQLFANDMMDSRVLIAVTASSNRSKSDRDLANWLPKASKEVVCDYVFAWIAVKMRYYLSVDSKESAVKVSTKSQLARTSTTPASIKSRVAAIPRALAGSCFMRVRLTQNFLFKQHFLRAHHLER